MQRFRPLPVTVFGAVTAAIWTTRLPLAWISTEGDLGAKLVTMVPVVAFGVPAVLVLWWCAAGPGTDQRTRTLVRALAVGTIGYWALRLPLVAARDHPAGFLVVHAVLAVASVASAGWAWRSIDDRHHRGVRPPAGTGSASTTA